LAVVAEAWVEVDDEGLLLDDDPDSDDDDEPEGPTVTVVSSSYEHGLKLVTGELLLILPPYSTDGPGLGKTTSLPSIVMQVPSGRVLAR
jgi:hypothetical protein